jgi:hypothetical protein
LQVDWRWRHSRWSWTKLLLVLNFLVLAKLHHCMAVVDELQMVLVRYHLHHLTLRELLM